MQFVIRADGSNQMGLGHILRSIAYAEEARARGMDVQYVIAKDPVAPALAADRGFRVDVVSTYKEMSWLDGVDRDAIVLVDGFHFGDDLFAAIRSHGSTLAVMDQTVGTTHASVSIEPESDGDEMTVTNHQIVLRGIKFAPIRKEFRRYRRHRGEDGRTLLVTMGGSDPTQLTEPVVNAVEFAHKSFSQIVIAVGPAAMIDAERFDARVRVERAPRDVAALFDIADAAISAAGTAVWELLCMGIPTAVIEVNDNQKVVAAWTEATGCGIRIGRGLASISQIPNAIRRLSDPKARAKMSGLALHTVDGEGAERVLDVLTSEA